jgi:hypothetical protein
VTRKVFHAVKKAMLPWTRPHDLRHTHATLALQAGVHPKVVSERLGHVTVAIASGTEAHLLVHRVRSPQAWKAVIMSVQPSPPIQTPPPSGGRAHEREANGRWFIATIAELGAK